MLKRHLMDSFLAPHNGLPANRELKAEELPKKSSDHGSKGTFPPEFVVNAQVSMKNLPLCERQRFLF